MNYQEMSDEKIECAVSDALGIPRGDKWCSDWAESGPIIHDNCISLYANKKCKSSWLARCGKSTHFDENPLRAAMIVFLMMKGGE